MGETLVAKDRHLALDSCGSGHSAGDLAALEAAKGYGPHLCDAELKGRAG